jgi:hypothetical protein
MTIQELSKRPKFYYNIDGVGELGMGFMMAGYGLIMWLQVHTPEHTFWHQMYVFVIYVGAMVAIIHYGSKAIKEHITYPRTGYVEYRTRAHWGPAIAGAVVAVLLVPLLVYARRAHWDMTASVSLFGLLMAAGYARGVAGWAARWKWAIVWLLAAGSLAIPALPVGALASHFITTVLPEKLEAAFLLLFLFYGALLMASGGISLWLYIRHTQAAPREAA